MKLQWVCALAVSAVFAGCATTGGGPESRVRADNVDSLVGQQSVYIGQFAVTFITKDKASARADSPMMSDSSLYAQSTVTAELTGVPDEVFASIATKAYEDFVSDLTAKGFVVKDNQELMSNSDWSRLEPLESPYRPSGLSKVAGFLGGDDQESVTFSADSLNLYTVPASAGMAAIMPVRVGNVAAETNTPIFMVNYVVHFAYFDTDTDFQRSYNDFTGDTVSAEVSLGQGIQAMSGSTAQFIVDGGGTFTKSGSVSLRDSVVVGGAYGTNEETTSGLGKAANAFSSFVGAFSSGSSQAIEMSVIANPEYFEAGALQALDEANNRIVGELSN